MQIEIRSKEVEKQTRVWEGKERVTFAQWCLLSQGGFVLSFVVSHQREEDAYTPGMYEFDPTSFSSNNGRLSVERVRLKPLAKSQSQAPKA